MLDVRLNKKVPEQILRTIALKLKGQDPGHYERTFITYLLPGMKRGHGCWATTHFTPDLEVRILGLTIKDEARLREQALPASGGMLIGIWLDDGMLVGSRITIYAGQRVVLESGDNEFVLHGP